MKISENNYLIRQSFSPSFMKIGQKLWIFTNGQFLHVSIFFTQTSDQGFLKRHCTILYGLGTKGHQSWPCGSVNIMPSHIIHNLFHKITN